MLRQAAVNSGLLIFLGYVRPHCPLSGAAEPDAHQHGERYQHQEAVDKQQERRRQLPGVRLGRRRTRIELAPHGGDEAEGAEQRPAPSRSVRSARRAARAASSVLAPMPLANETGRCAPRRRRCARRRAPCGRRRARCGGRRLVHLRGVARHMLGAGVHVRGAVFDFLRRTLDLAVRRHSLRRHRQEQSSRPSAVGVAPEGDPEFEPFQAGHERNAKRLQHDRRHQRLILFKTVCVFRDTNPGPEIAVHNSATTMPTRPRLDGEPYRRRTAGDRRRARREVKFDITGEQGAINFGAIAERHRFRIEAGLL